MPRLSDRDDPGAVPDFDDFYLASRRRLVLSAYALTGDLAAARNGVETAFVAARHHWRKVRRLPDLNAREIWTLVPLLILIVWIGVYPKPFTAVTETAVAELLQIVRDKQAAPKAMAWQTPTETVPR